jgi:hypothetical protein
MKKTYVVARKDIPYLLDSRWGKTLKIGSQFTIMREVGCFYKIKSPEIDDSTTLVSILKNTLEYTDIVE